jgi:hypothetical protein
MTTSTRYAPRPFGFGIILIAVLIIGAFMLIAGAQTIDIPLTVEYDYPTVQDALTAITQDTVGSHADVRHPESFAQARNLCNGTNKYRIPLKPTKWIDIGLCDGIVGFQVWIKSGATKASERTAYVKESVHSFDDLLQFCKDNGLELQSILNGVIEVIYKP